MSVHILVPGKWTVQHGHRLLEQVEREIRQAVPNVTVFTHLEPLEDPTAWEGTNLDRAEAQSIASNHVDEQQHVG